MTIAENLENIRTRIANAAQAAGRRPEDIILLGATKTVEPPRIQEAVDAGLAYIGENRVQELTEKFDKVHGAEWHFIGHLQTNKVKYIIDKAVLIHAADSARLLDEIERQAASRNMRARVLIEVNASGEDTKFGMTYDDVLPILDRNELRQHVQIEGLMTIGPHNGDTRSVREVFAEMYKLYDTLRKQKYENTHMRYLSMGMSGDYESAIAEGADIVRIGSAIFGHRG